jgi:hypothetical protein
MYISKLPKVLEVDVFPLLVLSARLDVFAFRKLLAVVPTPVIIVLL